jgi:tetratricopeptide (TPR) repeat protein
MRQQEALESFTAAFERTRELTNRNPRDGDALFERAQAEFWIGSVHYKQLAYDAAELWFTRYRDSGKALVALEPGKIDWQREAVLGYHNLAVLELQRGNTGAAREGFLKELVVLETIVAANPGDLKTRFSIANTNSFLATTAERMGEFAEALARFDRQIATLDGLIKDDPESAHWPRRRTDAFALRADVLAISGRPDLAIELLTEALRQFEQLASRDPTNQDLRLVIAGTRTRLGASLIGLGRFDEAVTLLREARTALYPAGWGENASAQAKFPLASACRWLSVAERAAGHQDAALAAAEESVTLNRKILTQNRGNVNSRGDAASAFVVAGVLAQAADPAKARQRWEESIAVLGDMAGDTRYWRQLDPLLRAHALLGEWEQAKLLAVRLRQCGYRPLEKWPEGAVAEFSSEQPQPSK